LKLQQIGPRVGGAVFDGKGQEHSLELATAVSRFPASVRTSA
jgi:hypothetical protein